MKQKQFSHSKVVLFFELKNYLDEAHMIFIDIFIHYNIVLERMILTSYSDLI